MRHSGQIVHPYLIHRLKQEGAVDLSKTLILLLLSYVCTNLQCSGFSRYRSPVLPKESPVFPSPLPCAGSALRANTLATMVVPPSGSKILATVHSVNHGGTVGLSTIMCTACNRPKHMTCVYYGVVYFSKYAILSCDFWLHIHVGIQPLPQLFRFNSPHMRARRMVLTTLPQGKLRQLRSGMAVWSARLLVRSRSRLWT